MPASRIIHQRRGLPGRGDSTVKTYSVDRLRAYDRRKLVSGAIRKPRYLEQVPPCWMCDALTVPQSTREHIFGQWTGKHFDKNQKTFHPHRDLMGAGIVLGDARGPMPTSAMVAGGVCSRCNNGWMSDLEAVVEQILFRGSGANGEVDAMMLARWFAKTAAVVNFSQDYPLAWPAADRHRLQYGMGRGCRVSIFKTSGSDINWLQGEGIYGAVPSAWGDQVSSSISQVIHTCRVRIGHLVGVIVRLPWQIGTAETQLPGVVLWDGITVTPLDLAGVPVLNHWQEGTVSYTATESPFADQPRLDFWTREWGAT